ncbi:MAG: TRAP transporter small permease [Dehalococcoidia bacterium]
MASTLNHVSGWLLLLLAFLLGANIVGRLFGSPIVGTHEAVSYGFAIVISFGIVSTTLGREHVSIELFFSKFPGRVQTVMEIINHLLGMGIFSIIAWRLIVDGREAYVMEESTFVLGFPVYTLKFAVAFGCVTLVLALLMNLFKLRGARA